ncbi:DUF2652 domain-containing protein, partial [Gemmatimonadota bacterium]
MAKLERRVMESGDVVKKTILIIADISGYTKFMISNNRTLMHSQVIITELINTIIKQIEIPLEISKLEGDAIFFYAVKKEDESEWESVKKEIGRKLISFFTAFSEKVVELSESNICDCNACNHVSKLKLKAVVHYGEALLHRIGKFFELSGVDVIIVHRLLKNSVNSDQYILMTEPAYDEIEFPEKLEIKRGEEKYEEIGTLKTCLYLPPGEKEYYEEIKAQHSFSSFFIKMKNAMIKMYRALLIQMG